MTFNASTYVNLVSESTAAQQRLFLQYMSPRNDFDIGDLADLHDGTQLAQSNNSGSGRRAVRSDDDYTKFVRPEYELGCDIGERRSREFWQRRFGVTPD